jgi:hypothetical protein
MAAPPTALPGAAAADARPVLRVFANPVVRFLPFHLSY